MSDLDQDLADLAVRTRQWAEARRQGPGAGDLRVRLARPLDGPPISAAVAEILAAGSGSGGLAAGAAPAPPWADSLEAFQRQICECQRCPLGAKRKKFVFGEGNVHAPLVFVGDGPGGEDEAAGRAFQGPSGDLLERILAAMGFKRGEVYLCNVLKCRPVAGLGPQDADAEACSPYLQRQLDLLKPKAVVALGALAARLLSAPPGDMAGIRGRWIEHRGLPVMPTYHPADLLRDPALKRHVWDDMKQVLRKLNP